jgi:ADP-ribosylglycohydrolase
MTHPTEWEELIRLELLQRREEGCDTGSVQRRFEAIRGRPELDQAAAYEELWATIEALPSPREAQEPSTLEAIRARRPPGPRRLKLDLSEEELRDKLYGAWLGRAAGCMLGKPVEGWTKADIDAYLQGAGEPGTLSAYFPWIEAVPEGQRRLHQKAWTRGHITHAARDDDTDYTLLGLHILETYGPDFSSQDVAQTWLARLPYHCVYTAERVAYRNLVLGLQPPACASYRNPYREWIGAQIRADGWGYAAPGWPEKAAEMAFRDACISHVKNGIYGEMFVAAMLAAAAVTDDIEAIIRCGQSEIPAESRLSEAIDDLLTWSREVDDWEACWERIQAKFGHYHPVHTINNAALVLLGLLYGRDDFGRVVGIAVHGGWDTDCNGATAGSIAGLRMGAKRLPEEWIGPLNDRLESIVVGFADNRISDLAERTLAVARRVIG